MERIGREEDEEAEEAGGVERNWANTTKRKAV